MSTNPSPSPRYADRLLAWGYDQRNDELDAGELEWYLKYAAKAGGPLLELACGSGRLLLPIAKAGFEIDGVDNAQTMLERLIVKMSALDIGTRSRIRTFHSDMVDFAPERRYAMVFVGYNSLQYLGTRERTLECFRHVHTFLTVDGFFLFMVRHLDLSQYADGKRMVLNWMDQPVVDPESGVAIGSRFVSYLEADGTRLANQRTYQLTRPTGETKKIEFTTFAPVLAVDDYAAMLAQTGFTATAFGGYDERPEDGMSRYVCFVCRKRGS